MFEKYSILLLLILLSTSFNSLAQTQAEMNQTANNDFKKADAKLNKFYKQVMKILNEKEKKLMVLAQKDWVKFRDSHCKFEIEQYDGGSIQPLLYSTCLTDRTNDRIEDLKEILNDKNR
jgi:uncharacterized protein YecT (DUF1311 family)